MNLNSGQILNGYVLEKLLSANTNQVWLAFDQQTERDVIIKFIPNRRAALRERDLLTDIDHPNIIKLLSVFEGEGCLALVLEYKSGERLSEIYETLDEDTSLSILIGVGSALQRVHESGFWHGDVSIYNIVCNSATRYPHLIDFSYEGKCAVGFIAPEDLEGSAFPPGPGTDVYRFGKLIELLLPSWIARFEDCFFENPEYRPKMETVVKKIRAIEAKRQAKKGSRRKRLVWTLVCFGCAMVVVGYRLWPAAPKQTLSAESENLRKTQGGTGSPKAVLDTPLTGEPVPRENQYDEIIYMINDGFGI